MDFVQNKNLHITKATLKYVFSLFLFLLTKFIYQKNDTAINTIKRQNRKKQLSHHSIRNKFRSIKRANDIYLIIINYTEVDPNE